MICILYDNNILYLKKNTIEKNTKFNKRYHNKMKKLQKLIINNIENKL